MWDMSAPAEKTTPAGLEPACRRACPATHPIFEQRSDHVRHRKRAQIEKENETGRKTETRSVIRGKETSGRESCCWQASVHEITENRRGVAPRGNRREQGRARLCQPA